MAELGAFDELPVFQIMKAAYRPATRKPGGQAAPDRNDVQGRLADMNAAGVDMQIVGLGAPQPYFTAPEKAVSACHLANDLSKELMEAYPERFSAFGAIPLPHPEEAAAEVVRCLDELGFAGIGLGCSAAGIPLDHPRFDPVWATLDAHEAVVFLHPGVGIDGIVGGSEYHLAPDFVSPAEIAVATSRLVVSGLTGRYSNVKLLLATTGGSLPFFARRFDRGLRQDDSRLHNDLGGFIAHLRSFHYDTSVLEEPRVLRAGVDVFGSSQIMLGSDYARAGVTSAGAVSYVADADFLSDDEKRAMLDENAARLFGSRLLSGHGFT